MLRASGTGRIFRIVDLINLILASIPNALTSSCSLTRETKMKESFEGTVPTIKLLDGNHIPQLAWGNGTGNSRSTPVEAGISAVKAGIRELHALGYDR